MTILNPSGDATFKQHEVCRSGHDAAKQNANLD
jgi:hypothetical protein